MNSLLQQQSMRGALVADGASIEAFKRSAKAMTLAAGQTGRTVVDGFGLGLQANFPGTEHFWKTQLASALQVLDVHGEGRDRMIIEWRVPTQATTTQAQMGLVQVIVLVGLIAVALLLLAFAIMRIQLLVDTPIGAAVALGGIGVMLLIGGIVVLALMRPGRLRG